MRPKADDSVGSVRRGPRLSTVLVVSHLAMILAAIGLVGGAGVTLLGRLTHEYALARARLAALNAVSAIERTGARSSASTLLLAERPTLRDLLSSGDELALREFLEAFRQRSQLSGCAVTTAGKLVASSGSPLPWLEIGQAGTVEAPSVYFLRIAEAPILMAARARIPGSTDSAVLAVRVLDDAYVERTSGKVGLPLALFSRSAVESGDGDVRWVLRREALRSPNGSTAENIEQLSAYFAVAPLRDMAGEIIGVVEAELASPMVRTPQRKLAKALLALTLAIGVFGVFVSLLLARRLARPLERLTEAAARIGRGDLSAPVPVTPGAEAGMLSATMEEMRSRMLELMTELRRKQAEAQTVLEGITEGVFAVDRERRVRYLNSQAASLLGVDGDAALGRFCGDLLNPRGRGGIRPCEDDCPILHARFRGNTRAREQLSLPGRGQRSVVITSSPSEAEEGAAGEVYQFQVLRDETDLEATRRLRDTVLANISHEFRSPLSAQLASLELLRDRLPELSAEQIQELVLSLERGALRLTRLIDNLLESTRIEAGESGLRRTTVSLDEVVEEAIALMAPLIQQREQRLEVDLPFPLPSVVGDAPRLTQVLVNLLANANKFAPSGTTIAVGGGVRDNAIELWVEDEGPGLPPGTREAVFERFLRSPGEEPQESGMGLGLWIVKSIVERHGGRVEALSADTGTRMSVILPRGETHEDTRR